MVEALGGLCILSFFLFSFFKDAFFKKIIYLGMSLCIQN